MDWVVSSGELNEKPVVAISVSPMYSGGDKALASLLLTLTALGTKMDTASSLSIANIKNKMNAAGECIDDEMMNDLQLLMDHLLEMITAGYYYRINFNAGR